MLRTDIKKEVYRFNNDDYWGAPDETRIKAINFLNALTETSLTFISEEEVRPTTSYCIDITLSNEVYELLVMIGDNESAILLWCNGKPVRDDIGSVGTNKNLVIPMQELAHVVNSLVNKYLNS